MKVISNFCDYNDEGFVVGLKSPMIHMFNKVICLIFISVYIRVVGSQLRSQILISI